MQWLREQFPAPLQARADADVAGIVVRARTLGPVLGLEAGRDVTTLAEALVLGFGAEDEAEVRRAVASQRRTVLEGIRDRLVKRSTER